MRYSVLKRWLLREIGWRLDNLLGKFHPEPFSQQIYRFPKFLDIIE
jgi:hypothetical protein